MKSNQFYFNGYKEELLVGTWNDQRVCSKDLGISYKGINACLCGNRKITNGYTFKKIAS